MAEDDERNPLEDLLRQFGLQPGPDGTFDVNALMSQLHQAMGQFQAHLGSFGSASGASGLNWAFIKDTARKVTAASGPDPSPTTADVAAVRDTVHLADLWLDEHTSFARPSALPAAWSRAEWVEHTMAVWQRLVDPVSGALAASIGNLATREGSPVEGMGGLMEPLMRAASTGMLAAQVGQALGQLSTDVVSVSDIAMPLTDAPVVALLPANVRRFADGLDQPLDDVRLYLALREAARQRLFAHVGWLGPQVLALVEHYARDITIDASAIEEALDGQFGAEMTADALEQLGSQVAGKLFQPTLTDEQREILGRLETLVALIEGWVDDVVTQTTAPVLPQASALLETVRRRRASAGPAELALKQLLNLELRPRRVRDAANLWAIVRTGRGVEGRDALWAHPDLMPTGADLDDPLGFAEHGRALPASDDLDAQLRDLLDQEGRSEG